MRSEQISSVVDLRAVYPQPPQDAMALRCIFHELDTHHRAFIALSPFLTIATADRQGAPDVSPRGDLPGFVRVRDATTLLVPDRPGNKKLLTLTNILENPTAALIFFVPGRTESLRVNGTAQITTDRALLAPLAVQGKLPPSALIVKIELVWFHCGRALVRSRLWDVATHPAADALPSLGRVLADQIAGAITWPTYSGASANCCPDRSDCIQPVSRTLSMPVRCGSFASFRHSRQ